MIFSKQILLWYAKNKRELPWRNTTDAYHIWLSEIMLQQTRVAQGTPYYLKFIDNFPTVQHLAAASEEKVLKLWQGLGYYSRARNLHATAKIVTDKYNARFPDSYKELIKLKGVGDYTASAIASISFNRPEAVVDGNVYRVLARYYGVSLAINSSEGIHYFKALAERVMDVEAIREYNQAIMEFGAIQCVPRNPNCGACPLQNSCVALKEGRIDALPVKLKKLKVKLRYFNYLVLLDDQKKTILRKRTGKGIWQNLYEFPLVESDQSLAASKIKSEIEKQFNFKNAFEVYQYNTTEIVHKLSHQHLYTTFWIVSITDEMKDRIPVSEVYEYPVPVLIADFINAFKF
ncbi:A/G-specific adenine glycosylase [Cellulophaga sp. Hel_I_12]|uniref:A/G-specific adenine glycosylase n=1 Tax=Cellulophaga sp. Hel_I_12 TaxID=1249972 RepID=UPI000647D63D|nr:A/G-specific adenine glycosylase [Cellulophaga sp. Hel_I_12]